MRPWQRGILAFGTGALGGLLVAAAGLTVAPVFALAVSFGLAVAAIIFLYPVVGLYLTAAVIPMERFGRFTDDASEFTISIMRILGVLVLGAMLFHLLTRRSRVNFDPSFTLYGIYWGFIVLGIFFSTDRVSAVQFAGSFLGNLMYFFVLINLAKSWSVVKKCTAIWLAATVVVGLYTMYDWHFGSSFTESSLGVTTTRFSTVLSDTSESTELGMVRRAVGSTSNPAVYGIDLAMTLPFFAFFFRASSRPIGKVLSAAGAIVVLYNMFLANTRAVFLLAFIIGVIALWKGLARISIGGVVTLLIAGVGILPLLPHAVYERILDPSNYSLEHSGTLRIRLQYWKAGLEVAAEHWLMGTGAGNRHVIPEKVRSIVEIPAAKHTAHNEFITSFIEVGVIGWSFFMAFIVVTIRYTFKAAATFRAYLETQEQYWYLVACQICLFSVLIFGLQVDVLHFPLKGWWLVVGLTCIMHSLASGIRRWRPAEERGRVTGDSGVAGAAGGAPVHP